MRIPVIVILTATVSACVPAARPPAAPAPAPATAAPARPPVAMAGSDWRDWAVTPGDWTYRREAVGSVAGYGRPGEAPLATLRCDLATRTVALTRIGVATGVATGAVTIRTSSVTRALPLTPGATVAATLAARDPLLDAMVFSRGHFTMEQPGMPPLVLPAWAEVGRIVEDCRA